MKLNWLTNPNPNLQAKMRYFADYFLYSNEFLGKLPDLPFDNPISYISKIVFQIDNNIERSPHYIDNHFQQLTHFFGNFLKKHFPSFEAVKISYDLYNQAGTAGKKVKWLKANQGFKTELEEVQTELETSLFGLLFSNLTKFIVCRHSLQKHRKGIEFYTQLLVSLFRLNNHSKKSVDKYIDRILSSNMYEFPFPLDIYEHNKDESYQDTAQDYLNNRDFIKQFEGLQNLMINPRHRKGHFVYVINRTNIGKELENSFFVKLNRVTFISPAHPQFRELKKSLRLKDREQHRFAKMYPRFFGRHKLLAYIELNYESKKTTSLEGVQLVEEEIHLLNGYLDTNLQLEPGNFLFTEDFKGRGWHANISWMNGKIEWLDKFKHDRLVSSPFVRLKGHGPNNQLLHNEKVFIKADTIGPVSLFWQYIENLFWSQNVSNEGIRARFSVILSNKTSQFTDWLLLHIGNLFFGAAHGKYSEEFGPDQSTLELLGSELGYRQNLKFPIRKYLPQIKHPFLRRIIQYYLTTKSKKNREKWDLYFKSLILELQEIRNAELHSGYVNGFSDIKMKELVPYVMYKARWAIINFWEDHKELSFEEVIAHVSKPE